MDAPFKSPDEMAEPMRRSPYGLEFALLIMLPVAVLLAGAATFALAVERGFTPVPETAVPIRGH